ncbi:hypothetical protein [Nonomuraea sp. NPDC003804]|uniref:hypothetical protein n=1 Tax=Nonomuraea sp. NPDC003804 TaxID=3154547 RepID=UPI0033A36446
MVAVIVVQVFKNVGLNMELFLAVLQGAPKELFEAARLDGYIAVVLTVGTLAVSTPAGYAFARIRFRGSNVLFVIVLTGLLIPSEVTIVPLFQLFHGGGRPTRTGGRRPTPRSLAAVGVPALLEGSWTGEGGDARGSVGGRSRYASRGAAVVRDARGLRRRGGRGASRAGSGRVR